MTTGSSSAAAGGGTPTLARRMRNAIRSYGERTCLRFQIDGGYNEVSFLELDQRATDAAKGLIALGLERGDRVLLVGEASEEWITADLAALYSGATSIAADPTMSDHGLGRLVGHAEPSLVFVDSLDRAATFLEMPSVEHVVALESRGRAPSGVLMWQELIELGRQASDEIFEERFDSIVPKDVAFIMYTSGSSGEPKGVMRNHGNFPPSPPPLPPNQLLTENISHAFGRLHVHFSLRAGATLTVPAQDGHEVDIAVFREAQPMSLNITPRGLDKIWPKLLTDDSSRRTWKTLSQSFLADGTWPELDAKDVEHFVATVRRNLGDKIGMINTSGSTLTPLMKSALKLLGIEHLNHYGITEAGAVARNGVPFPGVEIRLEDDGEILVRSFMVMAGYYRAPELTREAVSDDGWYRTGDLGSIGEDGLLRITGRKRDTFYCSDGSNIHPTYTELRLEEEASIRQAILVGDHKPYITALIVLDRSQIADAVGISADEMSREQIEDAIWSRLDILNETLEPAERIKRIALFDQEFPKDFFGTTAIDKRIVHRKRVESTFGEWIDKLYKGAEKTVFAGTPILR